MADPKNKSYSESEQMYLVTTATLLENGADCPVPLSSLAKELDVLSVSANQMVRKLAERGLVHYQPYHGVELTKTGAKLANRILRHRRLWQVFLIQHLELPFQDAEALACKMEHLTSPEIAERLSHFLNHPRVTPQGRLIPPGEERDAEPVLLPLSKMAVNQQACIIKINGPLALRSFLAEEGLGAGSILQIEGIGQDGAILVSAPGKSLHLTQKTAELISVLVLTTEENEHSNFHDQPGA